MAIAGELYTAGAQFAAEAIFGRGARSAAKDAAKAQKKLFELQAEEQAIRNKLLSESAADKDKRLPFALSLPGRSYGTSVLPEGSIEASVIPSGGVGVGSLALWLIVGAAVFLLVRR